MNPDTVVNKLLEVDDPDVERYLKGVVPPKATLWDLDNALWSRGFQFWEYDGTPPVLVNRWLYKQGDEFWMVAPLDKKNPKNDWFNIQCWRGPNLVHNFSAGLQKVVEFFDKNRKT
jgi:hypothetical protein